MSVTNGRPEPEVIVNFSDGFSYVKAKLEAAYAEGGVLEKSVKPPKQAESVTLKKEDIDLIVNELELSRTQAEKALQKHRGDVSVTLRALVLDSPW
ncbi:hypothetical protein CYLTODRAFT_402941 [Cylindrobasidium torrendii FP15055 ss-10]|uniref:Nascent polypeptide-associated complex subunit alpha-like UBA domain-containing protein n=1 Tax=Cylindrobasidium torrendii FP15055 ss-10 TaxID=1314674 RepID=A0A0D7AZ12_9AGAR|nr:hypothetical protein CYLTODRAFT_402941 [Cylindrobasidium torrendii FP15055 ss-10]